MSACWDNMRVKHLRYPAPICRWLKRNHSNAAIWELGTTTFHFCTQVSCAVHLPFATGAIRDLRLMQLSRGP